MVYSLSLTTMKFFIRLLPSGVLSQDGDGNIGKNIIILDDFSGPINFLIEPPFNLSLSMLFKLMLEFVVGALVMHTRAL